MLDILNFGNLINKCWGWINEVVFGIGGVICCWINYGGIDFVIGKMIYVVNDLIDFMMK